MNKRWIAGMVSAALATMAFAGTALADRPDKVKVRGMTHNGSGCPLGTVAANISADNEALTLLFSDYVVSVSPHENIRGMDRKVCTIIADLEYPEGWSVSLAKFTIRGYATLDPYVRAIQKSTYRFQGQDYYEAVAKTTLIGEYDNNFQATDAFVDEVWSPCGAKRSLVITTEARVENRKNPYGEGVLEVDSLEGEFKQIYALNWRRCY